MKKKTVLTIGGSDPSGGAGIQTDIKAITSLNLHAAAIPSCITVQNTQKVSRFQPVSKTLLQQQIDTLMEDVPITYVKIGMLANKELIEVIANLSHLIEPLTCRLRSLDTFHPHIGQWTVKIRLHL